MSTPLQDAARELLVKVTDEIPDLYKPDFLGDELRALENAVEKEEEAQRLVEPSAIEVLYRDLERSMAELSRTYPEPEHPEIVEAVQKTWELVKASVRFNHPDLKL